MSLANANIGIVGAGIMGRLLAWQLAKLGNAVTLFDKDTINLGAKNGIAAAYTAAGMLSPISEADSAEEEIVEMGLHALTLWPQIVADLNGAGQSTSDDSYSEQKNKVDFQQRGSLVLSHPNDFADLENFRMRVSRLSAAQGKLSRLSASQISEIEPELGEKFNDATFIQGESWLSPPAVLQTLAEQLSELPCTFIENTEVSALTSERVCSGNQHWDFDQVIDCRGLGAKPDMKQLRGVRGETIMLHAPDVKIKHLVRLMHPRYRIYIVPRCNDVYVIGATQIESDSLAPITVRSSLELLSAAYSVHSGFAEASIIDSRVNCRPALPDNLPQIFNDDGLMRINGLFRHGFLLAPALAEQAISILSGQQDVLPRSHGLRL